MTATVNRSPSLQPLARPASGEPLWGDPPRRQPIALIIMIGLVTLLIAAPVAFSGNGQTSTNPLVLMRSVADSTYQIATLLDDSNETLAEIDANVKPLTELNGTMGKIATSAKGMDTKTGELDQALADVGGAVGGSKSKLGAVDRKLKGLGSGMGDLETAVNGSLKSTRSIVSDFRTIKRSMGGMDAALVQVISRMNTAAPATRAFAENRTVKAVAGGDGTKYGAVNIERGNRVMSVVLPMITTMQTGGPVVATKNSAKASNILVGSLLNRQVPDGTNVIAQVLPYDGFYGMPAPQYFVDHRVGGF